MSCQYILKINPLSVTSSANIFSHPVGCLFILLMVSFGVQKLLGLTRSHLFIFAFIFITVGGGLKKILLQFMSQGSVYMYHRLTDDSVWVYFWTFQAVPLIYISGFMPTPCCFDDCSFVVQSEVREPDSSSSVFLSQYCFCSSGSSVSPYKFKNFLLQFCEKCHW